MLVNKSLYQNRRIKFDQQWFNILKPIIHILVPGDSEQKHSQRNSTSTQRVRGEKQEDLRTRIQTSGHQTCAPDQASETSSDPDPEQEPWEGSAGRVQ